MAKLYGRILLVNFYANRSKRIESCRKVDTLNGGERVQKSDQLGIENV